MATDFPSSSRDDLTQLARDLLRTRRRGIDVGYASDWDLAARVLGALAWGLQEQSKVALRLLDPRRAFGPYQVQLASEVGVGADITKTSTAAVKATGKVIIRSTTGSQTQLAGSVLRHADGTSYTLDANVMTPATATKVLRSGHRSGRRRLYQGHVGGGFEDAVAGEVYLAAATGEYVALRDVSNGSPLQRYLFDLYNELDADPEIHDQFAQQLGAVGSITAALTGPRGNKDAKDVLTVVSPAGTVIDEASILYLTGGADVMGQAEMQDALSSLYGTREGTGTIADLRALALGYPDADLRECYVIPATFGVSTYTLLPILDDGQYIGTNLLADIVDYVQARVSPVDKLHGAAVYEELDSAVVHLNVQVSETYAPDWTLADQTALGIAIATSGTSSLILASVDDMEIGDRVIITNFGAVDGAASPYIVQRRITTLSTQTIGLDEPLPFPPGIGTSFVTPGGPLADALIDAIYAAYEARAPSVSASGPQVRLPISAVSDDPQSIARAVSDVEGVVDVEYDGTAPGIVEPAGVLLPRAVVRMFVER